MPSMILTPAHGLDKLISHLGVCLYITKTHLGGQNTLHVSIMNDNVCGRFRDVLARKVRFLQVHNSASLVVKRVPFSSRLDIIGRDE
jgi:hypothetical protein